MEVIVSLLGYKGSLCTPYSKSVSSSLKIVEGLYCKRPIQCLASSEILTPPHRPASDHPPPPRFGAGGRTHSLGGEGGGGSKVRKTPDTALYSTYISKYFFVLKVIRTNTTEMYFSSIHFASVGRFPYPHT